MIRFMFYKCFVQKGKKKKKKRVVTKCDASGLGVGAVLM
jgi:hypothetical protein